METSGDKIAQEVWNMLPDSCKHIMNNIENSFIESVTADVNELVDNIRNQCDENGWIDYDFFKLETRPTKTGRYFVCRKDGKTHWEVWNGNGWAYNNNVIIAYKEIKLPVKYINSLNQ